MTRHLAHFNWASLRAAPGSPVIAEFEAAVDRINALAERCPGFVWRYTGDEAALCRSIGWTWFTDDRLLTASFSVWDSIATLERFVFKTVHGAFLRRGSAWFTVEDGPKHVLWFVPAGHIPDIAEARDRAEALVANGPSGDAFTFDFMRTRADAVSA